ncbi:hypothetical protein MLD38_021983 [Melastoma candidum]|uniref:Uncharacterized protein n=1 Tax=Melastoma candidum TaxID=119954 RepID=A0ACB9QI01_9MYRT|nr:hypothetical protein MLD38_021983 [Melastoma candidum]
MAARVSSSVFLFLLLLLVPSSVFVGARSVPSSLISDGISLPSATDDTCDQTYGFMPCTTTWIGNLFLILVYGYLMYMSATFLSSGSELLLEILGPGIIGGLFLPMLGALPDALLILVSGLSGTTTTAQSQVSVGMGLLAGSTVMLITVIWGTCVIVGKCDMNGADTLDKKDTRGFSLTGSGVSTDDFTRYAAWIMVVSVIPFIVVQVPQVMKSTSGRHLAVLIALVVSLALLISYCLYQIFQPWIQKRKLEYVNHKHVIFGFLKHVKKHALGKLMTEDGEVNKVVVQKLFKTIDENGDGLLSVGELKAFIVGVRFEEIDLDESDAVNKIMKDFDTSNDYHLDEHEFVGGITRWLDKAVRSGEGASVRNLGTMKFLDNAHHQTKKERERLLGGDQSDEVVEGVIDRRKITLKAVLLLILGTLIAAVFADPLVDAVDNFSDATGIPTFFISFIALPLATNSSEAVSAIIFASRKKIKTASLTFSELYGAVTMNNVLCLSVFLALVYVRGLTWDFSAEVLVIVVVCVVMGLFASFRRSFPLWTSFVAFALYPISLALVYVLDYVLGWS